MQNFLRIFRVSIPWKKDNLEFSGIFVSEEMREFLWNFLELGKFFKISL